MRSVLLISRQTIQETMREKVVIFAILFFLVNIVGAFVLSQLVVVEVHKVIVDFMAAGIAIFGAMLALFLGTHLIHKEIEGKTILLMLTKPMSRSSFLLGKVAGLTIVVSGVSILLTLMAAGVCWTTGLDVTASLFQSSALMIVELFVLISLSSMFSVLTNPVLGLFCGFSLYFVGHLTGSLQFALEKIENPFLKNVTLVFMRLFDLNLFNTRAGIVYNEVIAFEDFFARSVYGCFLGMGFLIVGTIAMRHREF